MHARTRVPLIAGNWKMNLTVDEAIALVATMRARLEAITTVESLICPPFVSLSPLHQQLGPSPLALGAQNVFWEDKGAFTGEVSPPMLAPLCRYVIIGHSERRQYFGETDEIVNRKVRACLPYQLRPILCVGESLDENEAGRTDAVVERQVRRGLEGIATCPGLVVAYEPIWAIGTGRPSTGAGAKRVIGRIRQILAEVFDPATASATRLLYGGSVTRANIGEFVEQEDIDGALVGGASLKPDEFVGIVQTTATTRAGAPD